MRVAPEPVGVADFVRAVCQVYHLPADRAWDQTLADLWLMLQKPADDSSGKQGKDGLMVVCIALEQRRKLYDRLTTAQKIELERWKAELM